MVELDVLLKARDITFDAEDRRIMCFPHIVNICCQHTIKKFTDVALANASEPTPVAYPPSGDPPESVTLRPLQLLRDVKTRWDSVYFMIKHLRYLHPVSCTLFHLNQTDVIHSY